MFEKEAEEYTVENVCSSCYFEKPCENKCEAFGCADSKTYVLKAFKDGAEFGYNKGYHDAEEHYMNVIDSQHKLVEESKANEWHYVKDGDLPKDEDWKWCVSYRGYCYVAKYEEMFGCWTNQEYSEVMQPYAWKEIVLPKESE